ncbi:hypothetical protein [Roseobacter sp. N2S]|uniref:hypothetical protein n=1 Tax=Roseobacter sp. N2S TaxID=2663844 RepID=UPI00285F76AD|nr:hypothetical protein [Roseobacter sp. N2S]MDR6263074.1 hypothetical protein [Roseobacter sp. N2S]
MLYYPHYTPSQERLRSLLLFTDTVSLIVPAIDQHGVERRQHVEEVLSRDDSLIEMKDPTYRYSGWMEKDGVAQATENLIAKLADETEQEGDLTPLNFDQYGHVNPGQDEEIAARWSQKGWKYVAEEKFPPNFRDLFFSDGMALRVGHFRNPQTGEIIEHNGVLCHPVLADFVLARMAREASIVDGIPSITFGGLNYVNHLFDGDQTHRADRFRLLQSAMDLFVPNNLGSSCIQEFLSIRQEYEGLRRLVWRYLEDISMEMNLDLAVHDQEVLLDRLKDARRRIDEELSSVKRQIGRERFTGGTLFALEAASTIGLAALGAAWGGPLAAAGTAGLGIAVAGGARKLSTLGEKPDGTAKSIAMTIAKIENRGVPKRRAVPNYWL